jgi:hypothetical protein
MPVLKQTSPAAVRRAPKPRPQNTEPSPSTRTAVAPSGTLFSGSGMGAVSTVGEGAMPAEGAPGMSDKARPVAPITAGQCRAGMARAWRHLRTASVPTPHRAAAASCPPRRRTTSSTLAIPPPCRK